MKLIAIYIKYIIDFKINVKYNTFIKKGFNNVLSDL